MGGNMVSAARFDLYLGKLSVSNLTISNLIKTLKMQKVHSRERFKRRDAYIACRIRSLMFQQSAHL